MIIEGRPLSCSLGERAKRTFSEIFIDSFPPFTTHWKIWGRSYKTFWNFFPHFSLDTSSAFWRRNLKFSLLTSHWRWESRFDEGFGFFLSSTSQWRSKGGLNENSLNFFFPHYPLENRSAIVQKIRNIFSFLRWVTKTAGVNPLTSYRTGRSVIRTDSRKYFVPHLIATGGMRKGRFLINLFIVPTGRPRERLE